MKFENIIITEKNKYENFGNQKITDIKNLLCELRKKKGVFYPATENYFKLSFIPTFFSCYRDDEGKTRIDSIFNHLTESITIKDIEEYTKKKENFDNGFNLSVVFSYYFAYERYSELINYMKEIFKLTEAEDVYISFNWCFDSSSENENYKIILIRMKICLLYALLKSNSKRAKNTYTNTLLYLNNATGENPEKIEKLFDNKFLCKLHNEIVKEVYEKRMKASSVFAYVSSSEIGFLSSLETNPAYLENFLNTFDSKSYYSIKTRDDWRIVNALDHFDTHKEEIVSIFRNFLKSKYSIGNKYSGLQLLLEKIKTFFEVLKYDEYSILDVIEGLPDKIQNAALKNMLGDI